MPDISLLLLINRFKIFPDRMKRYGAIGLPWQHPCWIGNKSERVPHCLTDAKILLFNNCIHLIYPSGKLQ